MDIFKDKIVIVTGGSAGIGKALCEEMSARGAKVVVSGRNFASVEEVVSGINADGGCAFAEQMDVSNEIEVKRGIDKTISKFGRLDYIINNAGVNVAGEMRDLSLEDWHRVIDVNFFGVLYGTMIAYKVMINQGFGHIVNISSLAGLIPFPVSIPYSTTKHAIVGLSTALRPEAKAFGVKVSVVCPGLIKTAIWEKSPVINAKNEDMIEVTSKLKMMSAKSASKKILSGIGRNKAIITFPFHARALWWFYRFNPAVLAPVGKVIVNKFRNIRNS